MARIENPQKMKKCIHPAPRSCLGCCDVRNFFWQRDGLAFRAAGFVAAWVVLISSKFVILEVVDILFGEHVNLGGFLPFILLSVSLLAAELVITRTHLALA